MHYAMEIGLAVHRQVGLDLLYVSLTDYVQHKQAPGGEMADCFFRASTSCSATISRGLRGRHHGRPRHERQAAHHLPGGVLFAAGVSDRAVVLPITDPYVVHHGALGSFAWVHLP